MIQMPKAVPQTSPKHHAATLLSATLIEVRVIGWPPRRLQVQSRSSHIIQASRAKLKITAITVPESIVPPPRPPPGLRVPVRERQ